MKRCFLMFTVMLSFVVVVGITSQTFAQCKPVSPYQDLNGWANWCRCMGGHIDNSKGNPECVGVSGSGSGSGGAGGSGLYGGFYGLGYQFGDALGKFIFGDPTEEARKRTEKEMEKIRAEEERERIAEKNFRDNEDRYQRLSNQLKGSSSPGSPQFKLGSTIGPPLYPVKPDRTTPPIEDIEKSFKPITSIANMDVEQSGGRSSVPANCGSSDVCNGQLVALTYFCKGDLKCPYVCCPSGFPFLNHCDCKCYLNPDFSCPSYSKCQIQPK